MHSKNPSNLGLGVRKTDFGVCEKQTLKAGPI